MDDADRAEALNRAEIATGVYRARRKAALLGGVSPAAITAGTAAICCAVCGYEIPPARRAAVPNARRCARCQAAAEKVAGR